MSGCIIKCSFCPKLDLEYCGIQWEHNSGLIPQERPCQQYCCHACHTDFYYNSSFMLIGWSFKADYRGDRFAVTWFENKTVLFKNGYAITEFTNRAHLTPSNLIQKLPTILVFL